MDEQAVHVIGVERLAMIVNHGQHVFGPAVHLGLDEQFFARQSLDGVGDPTKRLIRLRRVNVGDAVVVGVMDEIDERVLARRRSGRMPLALPVPKPSRLNLMPVLPSVTWSVAVRTTGASAAADVFVSAHGESSAVPASAVEAWMKWRRVIPRPLFEAQFLCMQNQYHGWPKLQLISIPTGQ